MTTNGYLMDRGDTAANWTSNDPILRNKQFGFETDTLKFKMGDGVTAWTGLSYAGGAALDAFLTSIAALGTAADRIIYTTGVDTAAETPLTAAARTVLDDATVAAMVDTLGGASSSGTGGLVRTTSPTLVTPALGTPTALVLTSATGLPAAGVSGTALVSAAIGTTVQAYDANLDALAGLAPAADRLPYFDSNTPTMANTPFTAAGRALLDDANAAAQLATLGLTTGYYYQRVAIHANAGAGLTLTTHPSTQQFLGNSSRNVQAIDLTGYSHARLSIRVTTLSGSANTPKLRLRYRTAFSATVTDYSDIGTSEVSCSLAATGLIVSAWIDLAAGAKADVFVLVEQLGGDSAASPVVGSIAAEFRVARYG